ncbi:DNA topoisomerase I [Alienimonas sp. DA493]|uniref:DNA topoisomerase I n=1 Tax=Alienimonas sp. DA493 TaxID=3373605 RepID=UPI0037553227
MWQVIPTALRLILNSDLLKPLVGRTLKPGARFAVGLLAVPLFRWTLKTVRLQHFDRELEKDLEEWFAASALLLLCTANMEQLLFQQLGFEPRDWISLGFRLLLAIGVVEAMPDVALFPVLHPKPKVPTKDDFGWNKRWFGLRKVLPAYVKGLVCQHLARSSPVLAILACVVGGVVDKEGNIPPERRNEWVAGWFCYGAAISQYLVMGLMASREEAANVLAAYDKKVAKDRAKLVTELRAELAHGASCPLPPRATAATDQPEPPRTVQPAPPAKPAPVPVRHGGGE